MGEIPHGSDKDCRLMLYVAMNDDTLLRLAAPDGGSLQCLTKPPCRILLVDDDSGVRQCSTLALVNSGYHVEAAEDGAIAWEALQIKAFNLLITDNNMPKLTGVELVRRVRAAHMAMPVIMATGRLPTEALSGNPSLQLAAMLPKPFSLDELLETVRTVLRATDSPREGIEPPRDCPGQSPAQGLQL